MNKIFLVNKREGMSSQSLVYKIKKKFNLDKVGHAGTLDPFASGLMLILTNEATKISNFMMEHTKSYVAKLKLGEFTESFDTEKPVSKKEEVPYLTNEKITEILDTFLGLQEQYPPVYSAIKIGGRKLYELKRNNEEIPQIKPRKIEIFDIKLLSYKDNILEFYVACSKGTYIRTLGVNIAEKLGTLGHLITLKRLSINNFKLEDAKDIENLKIEDGLDIKDCLDVGKINVDHNQYLDIKNGKKIHLNTKQKTVLLIYNNNELAIYERDNNLFKCLRGFNINDY